MKRTYQKLTRPGEGLDKLLGELEREIMEIMWDRGQGSVRDVLETLNASRPEAQRLAYTTVMTVMARLAEKGLLRRARVGKAHAYEAAESREAFLARASQEIARQLVEDFGEVAIAGFLNVLERVAPERLAQLRRRGQSRGEP
ncbi:MAG: BlaI/MecI/CopY family transcriptional regulator [Chloroflexi bacterium]|nr:BlaI/MecI/CopY family transcriptional regulator [Chloroflexota bacterium]